LSGFFTNNSRKRGAPQAQWPVIRSPSSEKRTAPIQETTSPNDADPPSKRLKRNPVEEAMPLAERMRPKSLDELIGHEDLVGENGVLRELILTDRVPSMILWAGPGVNSPRLQNLTIGG
jgi:putative ATPase